MEWFSNLWLEAKAYDTIINLIRFGEELELSSLPSDIKTYSSYFSSFLDLEIITLNIMQTYNLLRYKQKVFQYFLFNVFVSLKKMNLNNVAILLLNRPQVVILKFGSPQSINFIFKLSDNYMVQLLNSNVTHYRESNYLMMQKEYANICESLQEVIQLQDCANHVLHEKKSTENKHSLLLRCKENLYKMSKRSDDNNEM